MNETRGAKAPILLPALLALVGLITLAVGAWWMLSAPGRDTERIQAALNADLPVYGYEVVATHKHNTDHYTEGLALDEGLLYEGTGRAGESVLEVREFPEGDVRQRVELAPELFGEGVTVFGDRVYQLTYQAGTGLIYDRNSLEQIGSFQYDGEGWGLTHNGTDLIMSDGSGTLRFLDPETFEVVREITAHDELGEVSQLNELEFIDGQIYANVFTHDVIAVIDAETGEVTSWLDLSGLHPEQADEQAVLNGIADLGNGRLLVTGKTWDRMYEIEPRSR